MLNQTKPNLMTVVDSSTTSLFKHLKIHNIHPNSDKRGPVADSEVEASTKKPKTMMEEYFQRSSLQEIVSKLTAVDGISIKAISRSEFIWESIARHGFKLPINEPDVMKLIHDHYHAK
jgi:hypothetical protein